MNARSLDLRKRAIAYLNAGYTQRETAEHFAISQSSVKRWVRLLRTTGTLKVTPTPRSPHKLFLEPLKEYLDAHPDAFYREIAEQFHCSTYAVCKAVHKLGYTRKKNKRFIANGMNRKG